MVSGQAFLSVREVANELLAPSRRVEDGFDRTLTRAFEVGFDPRAMYALSLYRALMSAAGADPELHTRIGRGTIDRDLRSGPYRFLLRVLSVRTVASIAPRILASYYSHGDVRVQPSGRHALEVHWTDMSGFDGPLWRAMDGASRRVLELAGAKDLRWDRVEGGGDGDAGMVVHASWAASR